MRNKFRGPSPRPQIHSRPASHTPSPPPCSAKCARWVRRSLFCPRLQRQPTACASRCSTSRVAPAVKPLHNNHHSQRHRRRRSHSLRVPTGRCFRLGSAACFISRHRTQRRADLVLRLEQPGKQKALEEQGGRKGGRGFHFPRKSQNWFFFSWASFHFSLELASNIAWHCSY